MDAAAPDVPEGFRLARIGGPFIRHNGPLFARLLDGRISLAFRVLEQHTNPLKMCHGGMLASFADMLLPMVALYQGEAERRFLPTISLQIDYLAPAPLGAWVQGEGEVLRRSRNMVFAQGLVGADGAPVLRVSGIFKQGAVIDAASQHDPLQLRS